MTNILAITKSGRNVLRETDNNNFIINNNTFKIIKTGTTTISLVASTANQSFRIKHGLSFIPLVSGFAKETTRAQVFCPNTTNINLWGPKLGWTSTGVRFNYVAADAENVIFNFDETGGGTEKLDLRYFCLEAL